MLEFTVTGLRIYIYDNEDVYMAWQSVYTKAY